MSAGQVYSRGSFNNPARQVMFWSLCQLAPCWTTQSVLVMFPLKCFSWVYDNIRNSLLRSETKHEFITFLVMGVGSILIIHISLRNIYQNVVSL